MAKSRVIAKVIDNSDFSYFDVIRTFKKSKQAALDEVSSQTEVFAGFETIFQKNSSHLEKCNNKEIFFFKNIKFN